MLGKKEFLVQTQNQRPESKKMQKLGNFMCRQIVLHRKVREYEWAWKFKSFAFYKPFSSWPCGDISWCQRITHSYVELLLSSLSFTWLPFNLTIKISYKVGLANLFSNSPTCLLTQYVLKTPSLWSLNSNSGPCRTIQPLLWVNDKIFFLQSAFFYHKLHFYIQNHHTVFQKQKENKYKNIFPQKICQYSMQPVRTKRRPI